MLKNPFALDSTGRVVHIDDAKNPLRATAPFVCPGCLIGLKPRSESKDIQLPNGGSYRIRTHFYHETEVACTTGPETSLHLWAKMIIEEAMTIGLPRITVSRRGCKRDLRTDWTFNSVILEQWQDGIRPDIVMSHDEGDLNVEIRVHHAVDEEKKALLLSRAREKRRSCIEINLAGYSFDETPGEQLRNAILYDADRIWICHQDEDLTADEIEQSYWDAIRIEAGRIRSILNDAQHRIKYETRTKHENEIKSMGHAPFVGRSNSLSHWFSAPERNWQHCVLKAYVQAKLMPNIPLGQKPPGYGPLHAFQNQRLPVDPHQDILQVLGMTREEYGSPDQAVREYLVGLCDEPDRDASNPIARRILVRSAHPDFAHVAPERGAYILRRRAMFSAFLKAGHLNNLGIADFPDWFISPLGKSSPRTICIVGGPDHYRLLAYMNAISNMNDGGWPDAKLIGIGSKELRERRRREWRRPFKEGGGVQIPDDGRHRYCWSSRLISRRVPNTEILLEMAKRSYPSESQASLFVETAHKRLGGQTPREFAIDIPSLQACISLMPPPRDLHGPLANRRRVW